MFVKVRSLLCLIIFSVFTCFSQEVIENESDSAITFIIKNLGFNVEGRFNDFTVLSNFNSDHLEESFINVEISVKSIFTAIELRDEHLLKSDFFDVDTHPKIVFESSGIERKSNSKFILKGSLLMKGVKKRVESPLEIEETKKSVRFIADFTLNRKDFGVGGSSFILSKKVHIKMIYVADKN
ncbi:MAG: polyisoprenoid-binding protein YceI [Porticoccaceae bacterium]|jgi:polyisoprenoid-binding protein YceI